jgi:LytS/YehU family sensor histidine kinase
VVLRRADARHVLDDLGPRVQAATTEPDVLSAACALLGSALNATRVTWEPSDQEDVSTAAGSIVIPTAEAPRYRLAIGPLAGGRRLLSGDVSMLERAAMVVGRRLDTLRLTAERYERVLKEREIRSLATEAELAALRAQIHPHFLFNALTTIGYLIKHAPDRAVTTLLRLTTLLRSVLHVEGEFTTLRRESELVASYLDIERERFEARLQTTIDIPASLADHPIPHLLLQPLVENAVKHGIAASREGGRVAVRAALDGRALCLTVSNTGAPLRSRQAGPLGGVGLRNVERRLSTYYGEAATLSLISISGETVATLRIPVVAAAVQATSARRA